MQLGGRIQVRPLSGAVWREGIVRASGGRVLEVELPDCGDDCTAGTAAELESRDVVCLGIVDRRDGDRVWVSVEHLLDREALNTLRSMWGEQEIAEGMD